MTDSPDLEKAKWEFEATASLEAWKAKNLVDLEAWKAAQSLYVAGHNSVIGFANTALRGLLLINGGAIISLLTFFGNITRNDAKSGDGELLQLPMNYFIGGTAAAVLAAMLAYVTQSVILELHNHGANRPHPVANPLRFLTCAIALASLICFAMGAHGSLGAIIRAG